MLQRYAGFCPQRYRVGPGPAATPMTSSLTGLSLRYIQPRERDSRTRVSYIQRRAHIRYHGRFARPVSHICAWHMYMFGSFGWLWSVMLLPPGPSQEHLSQEPLQKTQTRCGCSSIRYGQTQVELVREHQPASPPIRGPRGTHPRGRQKPLATVIVSHSDAS